MRKFATGLATAGCVLLGTASVLSAQEVESGPFVVENYYRVKWGYQQEFLELYRTNHLPVLERMIQRGFIEDLKIEAPVEHLPEEARWDFRVTVTFSSANVSVSEEFNEAMSRASTDLFPDRERHQAEEKRRFELLLAHWDVSLVSIPLR